ncbi:hypothetical protein [Pseudomonas coleopterorum]|uniref:hypothetical protein n=1 Tax=Pseudomonas coleopterorum TaxID=1605838 RepID=UPI000895D1E6|nr:hypothetical protein [Pseudomonas coleopterorum]SEE90376.1 hypothetical protein SAMN05216510_4454 [Pseudomonas coleopterorum]
MSNLSSLMHCVAELPPSRGARRAHSCVPADHAGPCDLQYELHGRMQAAGFENYQQALTAATLAIFSEVHEFDRVLIRAGTEQSLAQAFSSAITWRQAQA